MKHKVLWLVSLVSVLALAACAGGTRKITIVGEDYHYDAEVWSAAPGQTVELTFTNNGSAEHEWVIIKLGESVSVPFDDDDEPKVFWEIEAEPGETKTETFTDRKSGV